MPFKRLSMEFDKNAETSSTSTSVCFSNKNVGRTSVEVSAEWTSKYVINGNSPEVFMSKPHK
jgi:hypothetical protein